MSEMMSLRQRPYEDKKASLNEALVLIETGDYIFIGSACGEPQYLVQGLVEKASHLADNEILHLHTGSCPLRQAHLFGQIPPQRLLR